MNSLAEFTIAFLELLEAEGNSLKREIVRLGVAVAAIIIAACLVLTAVGFLLGGVYLFLAPALGAAGAALLMSVGALLLAGAMAWTVKSFAT